MKICFFHDVYENGTLVWIAEKPYKVLETHPEQFYYLIETEGEPTGIGMQNKSLYYVINGN